MKKIFYTVSLVSALVLGAGVASAATVTTPAQAVKYTATQQACIKTAQDARSAATKAATDALNNATKDALKVRQDAIKAAQDIFSAATKTELKTEQDAIIAAQKSKDAKTRAAGAKTANDIYNNSKIVKQAKIPYMAAIKAANDEYNNSSAVKQAKAPYMAAIKAANDKFQVSLKACLTGSSVSGQGFFGRIGSGVSNAFGRMINFFSGKK